MISKTFFSITRTIFSRSRSEQFQKPNTIFEQEENSGDPYDFVTNLRSAIQKEISVIMDMNDVYPDYPDYSNPQKRRMQNQLSALVDMIGVQPRYPVYSLSPTRRYLPQQLMG